MDAVLQEDSTEASARLKWRPSRLGGRTIATPSAVPGALAAARRRANACGSQLDFVTDVTLKGEVGREDGVVVRLLMQHLVQSVGLQVVETDYGRDPKIGEFIRLASKDTTAPAGRVRLLLASRDEVRKVFAALHGQTIQVGQDYVGIEVANDAEDAQRRPGNGRGGRAS